MVIETFRARAAAVDERFAEHGRMLPPGLRYVDSWIDAESTTRCFQLMETDDPSTFLRWTSRWDDLVAFEIVPVVDSGKAAARASSETILRPPESPLP